MTNMEMRPAAGEINPLRGSGPMTMSSLQIAAKTGKRHHHVLRDIKKMLEGLGEGATKFGCTYLDALGKSHPAYNLPERECYILATGYSIPLRAAIIDEWRAMKAASEEDVDADGTRVAEFGPQASRAIGGIVKNVVHKQLEVILPAMVQAALAAQTFSMRRGKTAGQIARDYGFPRIRGLGVWLGNRLTQMGCRIEGGGRGELGLSRARLFDPDKADLWLQTGGGRLIVDQKILERRGQGRLRLVPRGKDE